MRLLVTGGTGFIGSHLAEEGRRRGADVVVLGLTDRPEEQANVEALAPAGGRGRAGQHHRSRAAAAGRWRGAPMSSTSRWRCGRAANSDEFFERSTSTAPAVCSRPRRRRRASGSSTAARSGSYGHRAPGITREDSPLAPGNIYERTKVAAERLVREFGRQRRDCRTSSCGPPTCTGRATSGCSNCSGASSGGGFRSSARAAGAGTWSTWTTSSPPSSRPASATRPWARR